MGGERLTKCVKATTRYLETRGHRANYQFILQPAWQIITFPQYQCVAGQQLLITRHGR